MIRRSFVPSRLVSVRFASYLSLLVLMAVFTAQACGPDFYPDVFVLRLRPDHPKEFAAGKLGILLPTYPRADLMVAFRYLNGGILTPTEQLAYQPTYAMSDPELEQSWAAEDASQKNLIEPIDSWKTIRNKYAAGPAPVVDQLRRETIMRADGTEYWSEFQNCSDDAFNTAISTLQSRVKSWGEKSADTTDWIRGQDTVFANCAHSALQLPSPAPANASTLLKADRAYQIAAAQFYGLQYGDARNSFHAIAQDESSPWHGIAAYMVARCLTRQAFYSAGRADYEEPAMFDPALMQQAEDVLRSLLKENIAGVSRKTIQDELDFVLFRTEPLTQVRQLSTAVAGPKSDSRFAEHFNNLVWYLNSQLDEKPIREDTEDYAFHINGPDNYPISPTEPQRAAAFSKTYTDLAQLRSTSTLVDWLITFQSPSNEAKDHAIAEWKSTHLLYWLLAAISKATTQDTVAPDLIAAAEQIKPDSPAWESLTYHRLRLLIALGHAQEAHTLLDQIMPNIQKGGRDSSVNAFLGLRMSASANLNEFLRFAPRKMISHESESQSSLKECLEVMKDPKRVYDCKKEVNPLQFSDDAAGFFNTQAPLSVLIESANSSALPQQLRTTISEMAWVRAVLLNDAASAAKLLPLLPQKLQQQAGTGTGFHPLMTLLRNPGLRPYLDPGVQRSYSYDFVESYGDNWWCQGWQSEFYGGNTPLQQSHVAFLTPSERSQGEDEFNRLMDQKDAIVYLGTLTLAYAKAHPNDSDVPESLYLVLRMIRYGCYRGESDDSTAGKERADQVNAIQKAAARLLRQRYTASPWTKKAAPFTG